MRNGSATPSPPSWYYRPWAVVVLLFVVLGPLALPLLWRSASFTRGWKIVLTLATVALTALLFEAVFVAACLALDQAAGVP